MSRVDVKVGVKDRCKALSVRVKVRVLRIRLWPPSPDGAASTLVILVPYTPTACFRRQGIGDIDMGLGACSRLQLLLSAIRDSLSL